MPSGSWPAWWAMGNNISSVGWPKSGEIDMMEYYRTMLLFNVMYANASNSPVWDSVTQTKPSSFGDSYHIWAMEWDAAQIRLYLDDVLMNTFDVNAATVGTYNPFRQPNFMMLNLAIGGNNGGNPAGTTFPLTYYVDYVRVYQASAAGTPISVNDNTLGTNTNQFNYSSGWSYGSQSGAYNNDNHWASAANVSSTLNFSGTKIQYYGAKNTNHGIGAVSIDGGPETLVNLYATSRADNVLLWTSPTLASGTHTFRLRVTGTKQSSSSGTAVTLDRVVLTP